MCLPTCRPYRPCWQPGCYYSDDGDDDGDWGGGGSGNITISGGIHGGDISIGGNRAHNNPRVQVGRGPFFAASAPIRPGTGDHGPNHWMHRARPNPNPAGPIKRIRIGDDDDVDGNTTVDEPPPAQPEEIVLPACPPGRNVVIPRLGGSNITIRGGISHGDIVRIGGWPSE